MKCNKKFKYEAGYTALGLILSQLKAVYPILISGLR